MAHAVVEVYHWIRMYYLTRYGVPADTLDAIYRLMIVQVEMLFDVASSRYNARYEMLAAMTPRERFIHRLKKEMA